MVKGNLRLQSYAMICVSLVSVVSVILLAEASHSISMEMYMGKEWQEKVTDGLKSRVADVGPGDSIPVIINLKKGIPGKAQGKRLYGKESQGIDTIVGLDAVNDIAELVESSGGRVRHRYKSLAGLSADVTKQTLERLVQDPDIESIENVRRIYATVEPNIDLVRANDTWAVALGSDNVNGKGLSVCVIDSGVDYTHPDLGNCTSSEFLNGDCIKTVAGYDFANDDNDPMDDNGHGSHVAGIAAANGSLLGVAPGASIVALKVLDQDGVGTTDDMNAAIDWCITNAAKYNISVISMSLGVDCDLEPEGCYDSYCDWDSTSTSTVINSSVDSNISVVISTGNDYEYGKISFPACIQKAIRVAATNSNDAFPVIGDFSNRAPGFPDMLTAPGYSINSSVPRDSSCTGSPAHELCDDSRYISIGGTSMAAPHVSGAALLFAQAYRIIYNVIPERSYMLNVFNSTGTKVPDAGKTGLSFSRIDIYASISQFLAPGLVVISPQNISYNNGSLEFNITTNRNLTNATFSVNSTSNCSLTLYPSQSFLWYNNTSPEMPDGYYNVTFWANDSFGNSNQTTVYFTVDTDAPDWQNASNNTVSSYSPDQISFFNITWDDSHLSSVLIEGNWSGNARNHTMYSKNTETPAVYQFNTTLPAGSFYWLSWANDTAGNWNNSLIMNISVSLANATVDLYLNGTKGNISVNQGNSVNITVIMVTNSTLRLLVNETLKTYPDVSRVENITLFSVPGVFNIAAEFLGNQNYSSNSSMLWVEVNDTAPPVIYNPSIMPVLVINGENITIKTNVSDYNIDSMWYNITNASDPEVTRAEGLMEMISNSYFLANYTTDLIAGDYYVTVHANDSYGNKANASSGSFRIEVPVNFTIQFLDYNGSVDSVSSIRIFYNGSEMIRNQISGSVSWMEDIIPFGLWDIIVESNSLQQSLNVTLMDANLSSNITKTMMLDLNVSATGTDPPNGIRSFSGIVAVNTTIGFNNALINMSFNITGSSNRSHTSVYACHSWNISTRSCSGSWVNASSNASFDMSRNTTSISVTGFSAFGITQDEYCGDGVCDNDESCSSCSSDCGSCPNDDDNDPGSNPGSTPSSSVTSSIEITTYPGVVIAKPGSVKDFLVGVRNNGYANLTRVGIGLLTNCSSCSLSSSPGEIDLERGETASFTASLSVGDQVTGQYSLDISAHSGLAAGDSVESIIAILQCFDGERRCIGNATQQCSDNEWSFVDECDHGCESGQCKPEPVPVVSCTPNQTKCSDNSTVNICTDEGDQWVFGEKCAFGCIDGSCVIAGSAPLNIMVVITNISIVIIVLTSVIVLWIYLSKRGIDNEWKALEDKYRGF